MMLFRKWRISAHVANPDLFAEFLAPGDAPRLGWIARTLQTGRVEMERRLAIVDSAVGNLADRLKTTSKELYRASGDPFGASPHYGPGSAKTNIEHRTPNVEKTPPPRTPDL